jgi:hypothetical protein
VSSLRSISLLLSLVWFFSGCENDPVTSGRSQLLFYAVEGETHFPIHIVVDSDTVGVITEPALFSGEFPAPEDSSLVVMDVANGDHSYSAFTYNMAGELNFEEVGPYYEGLTTFGEFTAEGNQYYIVVDFREYGTLSLR